MGARGIFLFEKACAGKVKFLKMLLYIAKRACAEALRIFLKKHADAILVVALFEMIDVICHFVVLSICDGVAHVSDCAPVSHREHVKRSLLITFGKAKQH